MKSSVFKYLYKSGEFLLATASLLFGCFVIRIRWESPGRLLELFKENLKFFFFLNVQYSACMSGPLDSQMEPAGRDARLLWPLCCLRAKSSVVLGAGGGAHSCQR